jgi:hypothetical protein
MTLRGQVMNGVVIFESDAAPPDGTIVEVTPVENIASPASVPIHPVSEEQRKALIGLIGMWKIENPPSDRDVKRIIDEARMRKYG